MQYPGSLPTMMLDLRHIRVFADYLRHTEIKFDLVSAVDELAGQVRMEFDFIREAHVMDSIADHLKVDPHVDTNPLCIPSRHLCLVSRLGSQHTPACVHYLQDFEAWSSESVTLAVAPLLAGRCANRVCN